MEAVIDIDLEHADLGEAVATKNPLAAYVALQASQTGVSIGKFQMLG